MAISGETKRRWGVLLGLRGALMVLAGLYAVIFPLPALTTLVLAAGILLVIDGALGLWSITFGGARTGNFWFDVARNVLALVTGLIFLLSPVLSTLLTVTFLVYLVAFQAILVGVMEIAVVVRERQLYARIWPVVLSGAAYILFGLALILAPVIGAVVATIIAGITAIVFGVGLLAMAWRIYREAPAA